MKDLRNTIRRQQDNTVFHYKQLCSSSSSSRTEQLECQLGIEETDADAKSRTTRNFTANTEVDKLPAETTQHGADERLTARCVLTAEQYGSISLFAATRYSKQTGYAISTVVIIIIKQLRTNIDEIIQVDNG